MRLTLPVFKVVDRWAIKQLWLRKGFQRPIPCRVPRFLEGATIVDPNEVPKKPKDWQVPNPEDKRFRLKNIAENHPDYHEEPIYEFHLKTRLLAGVDQACVLTKTQPFYGLPYQVEDLIDAVEIPYQDELVQRYIMQANVWNSTKDKLPRRFNPQLPGWKFKAEYGIPQKKQRMILMRNLLRLAQSLNGQHTDLLQSRRLAEDPYVSTTYSFQGNKPIMVRGLYDWQLSADRPLPTFGSEETVDASVNHKLPEFFPVLPTIDLQKQHVYRQENITGWNDGSSPLFPHTMFMSTADRIGTEEKNTRALMFCFARCVAHARQTYGADVTSLPEPVVTQCIMADTTRFHFVCFQLNTLDMSSEHGIKNLVWFDSDNQLFDKVIPKRAMLRNTKYEDYDPEVFRKFLAMYINGANLELS